MFSQITEIGYLNFSLYNICFKSAIGKEQVISIAIIKISETEWEKRINCLKALAQRKKTSYNGDKKKENGSVVHK